MIFSEEDQAFLDSLPDDDTIEPMTDEEKINFDTPKKRFFAFFR